MKRIFRFVVSFLLICVILVNCSPIRAKATGVEALYLSTVFVNPTIAVTAVLFGLGVMVTAAATAVFTKLVDDITVDMVDKGLISSSGVDMYRSDADGAATYLVNQELVEAVREYLWNKEIIKTGDSSSPGLWQYNGLYFPPLPVDESDIVFYFIHQQNATTTFLYCSSVKPYFGNNGYFEFDNRNGNKVVIRYTLVDDTWGSRMQPSFCGGYASDSAPVLWSNFDWEGDYKFSASDPVPPFSVSEGLTAGEIAPQDKTFMEGYPTWASGARTLPTLRDGVQTDAMSAYIALGMGMTQEETMAMTQAAVQSGVGTYENTGTTADTITASGLKGWLDTLRLSMVAGFSDVISGIKDFFTPSGTVEAYAIDLTQFFPFCIPFDLYDFLSLLLAEPEAPHLEFDIDFPYMDEPWHLVIDLSAWDGVAQLLRRLELLLFIVGLGMVTREKFLRG